MMALKESSHQVSNQTHATSNGGGQGLELRLDRHMNGEPYNRQFWWKKKLFKQTNKTNKQNRGRGPSIPFLPDSQWLETHDPIFAACLSSIAPHWTRILFYNAIFLFSFFLQNSGFWDRLNSWGESVSFMRGVWALDVYSPQIRLRLHVYIAYILHGIFLHDRSSMAAFGVKLICDRN